MSATMASMLSRDARLGVGGRQQSARDVRVGRVDDARGSSTGGSPRSWARLMILSSTSVTLRT